MTKRKKKKAGRPEKYPTKTIRIPVAIEEEVEELKSGYDMNYYVTLQEGKIKTIHKMPPSQLRIIQSLNH